MSFEFVIPVNRDDLLQKTGINQYVVDEVYAIRSLSSKLKECQQAYRSGGPNVILTYFDVFFSAIVHFNGIDSDTKQSTWQQILKFVQGLGSTLAEFVDKQDQSSEDKLNHVNALKMSTYLLCQFIDRCEQSIIRPSNTVIVAAGRGKKKLIKAAMGGGGGDEGVELLADWEGERERAVKALLEIFQLSIARLWDPPIVEEEFINMVTNTCYKLLESSNLIKNKSIRDAIFHLLGISVKRYNHSMGCTLKLLQLLQQNEQLALPCAQAIQVFVDSYGVKNTVSEIMREIGRMDGKELARDTSGTRAYAAFLLELSRSVPASVLPNISIVLVLLDGESYTMRNSVLGVIGELVIRLLSGETLDSKQKLARDQFLDKLEDHIHDVNAFVRSKVLQIWLNIVNEKALPLSRQQALLQLVIGRLQDKTSVVRKSAIQLLTALLRINVLAARLSIDELKMNYDKELAKLKEMMPAYADAVATNDANAVTDASAFEQWMKIEAKFIQFFTKRGSRHSRDCKEVESDDDNDDDDNENIDSSNKGESLKVEMAIGEDETVEGITSRIVSLLKANQFDEASALLKVARDQWPDELCFIGDEGSLDLEDDQEEGLEALQRGLSSEIRLALAGLKSAYIGHTAAAFTQNPIADLHVDGSTQADAVVNDVTKQQVLVQYLKDSVEFVTEIQRAVGVSSQLLSSKISSDILEAIDFFVSGFEAGVGSCLTGVRRMLPLVWSKEASVKDAVTDAYKRVYLKSSSDAPNQRAQAVATANALITLTTSGATLGDLTSLDELIKQFVKTGDLSAKVIQVLWEKFALKLPGTSPLESRGALILLGMVAGEQPEIVQSNIPTLISEGLGTRAEQDFLLARETCVAFSKLAVQHKSCKISKPFRLEKDHELFQRLSHLLVTGLLRTEQSNWIPMAEQSIALIYKLAEHPDKICGDIIKRQAMSIVGLSSNGSDVNVSRQMDTAFDLIINEPTPGENPTSEPRPSQSDTGLSSAVLTRFLFVCGHVAFWQLIHLDVAVFGEMKRCHAVQEGGDIAQSGGSSGGACRKSGGASVAASAFKQPKDNGAEEEMGLAGATAEDAEAEYIRKIAERDIVTGGRNLLSVLSPLVVSVCSNQARFTDPNLRTAAALALSKYMIVSSEFCEAHLPLLCTLLEISPQASVRANTIIALGDLTFRFPNLIEPWTSNIYARLRDRSLLVRKNTLMVLTHLILRDMIKVKGQISELAVCVIDDDPQISGLARLFFHELSQKGNAIYNILPDVISRLSDPEVGVEEEHFRTILKYLMSFIQKDKQCESLVEKLCHRFRVTSLERQWRDLSYCLSLLQYNDKSVRKLQENFSCFADKLSEDTVYESFLAVVASARKLSKPESKVLLDEFEQRLKEARTKGVDDDEAAATAANAAAGTKSAKHKAAAGKKQSRTETGRKKKFELSDSDDDEDLSDHDDDDDDAAVTIHSRQPAAAAASRSRAAAGSRAVGNGRMARPAFELTSSEDDDDAEDFRPPPSAKKGGRGRVRQKVEDDDDESPPSVIRMKKKSVCSKPPAKSSMSSLRSGR